MADDITFEELLEAAEGHLAPYATRSTDEGVERWDGSPAVATLQQVDSTKKYRTPFQVDRDRILYSDYFLRTAGKTQIFTQPDTPLYKTRMVHALYVMDIAKTIARPLRLNEDLVEAIALAHDIGHTPFGHVGERALNREILRYLGLDAAAGSAILERLKSAKAKAVKQDLPGLFYLQPEDTKIFMHGRQSFRILTCLEDDRKGLCLTKQVLYGVVRHSGECSDAAGTFAICGSQLSCTHASFEAQVVRLADDIAWVNHDFDDATRAGLLSHNVFQSIPVHDEHGEAHNLAEVLGTARGLRLSKFVQDIVQNTLQMQPRPRGYLEGQVLRLSTLMDNALKAMKGIVVENLHEGRELEQSNKAAEQYVSDLFGKFLHEHASEPNRAHRARHACDDVVALTDTLAETTHNWWFNPRSHFGMDLDIPALLRDGRVQTQRKLPFA